MCFFKKGLNRSVTRGFTLLEVVIALSVLTIAMVPVIGLVMVGLKNTQTSEEETHARNLVTAVEQDMRYTPPGQTRSVIFNLNNLPYSSPIERSENRVWIDLTHHVYDVKPNGVFCFELKWVYTRVPDSKGYAPVEAFFTVKWPPPNQQGKELKYQELNSTYAFEAR